MKKLLSKIRQVYNGRTVSERTRRLTLSFLVIQFSFFITAIHAQTPIKVIGSEVNLRSSPEIRNDNIIGKVVRDQKFVAVDKKNDATYGAWYKIAIPSKAGAAYGWVAQKTANGTPLTQEDSSLYGYIVTIMNDGGDGWRLRYLPADYDDYLKDKQGDSLKVWNNQKFIYKASRSGSDGCKWWEIYVPYLKVSADWGYEDYLALFVRDDAIRPTGKITGRVLNRANSSIAGASVKPFLKNGRNETYWNATTSSTGAYTCSGLPESTYTLEVTASGFTKVTVTVSVTSGGTTTQDIVLDETTPPTISNVRIDPPSLPSSGGTVTVRADVTDNVKVQNVWLWVKEPNGTEKSFTMSLESGNTYKGNYTAPANTSSSAVTYKVAITAKDASNNPADTGWAYSFTVAGQSSGEPPSKPSDPFPADGATDQPTSLTLSWSSSGATKYDLYFGTSSNPPPYARDLTSNQHSVSNLSPGTTYYWKVVAKNDYNQASPGDVWRFTTATSTTGRFKIGDRVCVTKAAGWLTVRDSPAGSPVKYMQSGQIGKIIGGPESKEGLTWWRIDWGDVQGWSHESGSKGVYLEALPGVGRVSDVSHGNLSWQVEVYTDADPPQLAVRSQPASTESDPPRKPKGSRGWTLDEAPVIANGKIWWLIRWDDGLVGWSADSDVGYGVYLVRKATAPFSGKMGLSRDPNQPIDFGSVSVNDTKDLSIRIYNLNDGTSNRVLRGKAYVSGDGFVLLNATNNTFSLWPGMGRIFTIRFKPTASGNYSGTLTIEHNADNYPNPLKITLQGNTGNVPVIRLLFSPTSVDFGQVEINTTRDLSVSVKNDSASTGTLTISNIQVIGNGFSLADGQPTSFNLSPGSSENIRVRFMPTAKADYSGTLRITHNATNIGSPLEIPLAGKGAEVVYRLSINANPALGGTVRVNGQSVSLPFEKTYAKGTNLTLEAVANSNYRFNNWSGSLSSTNSTLSLTVNSDISLTANFASASTGKQVLNVSVNNSALGEIRIVGVTDWGSSFSREFDANATVTLEARAKPGVSGVAFSGWSGAPSGSSGSSINVRMDRSYSIVALFTDTQKPVVENVALSRTNVNLDEEITITATATDNIGVQEVIATIRKPDGTSENLTLWKLETNTYSLAYRVTQVGTHTVSMWAKDNAGNLSENRTLSFTGSPANTLPSPIIIRTRNNKIKLTWPIETLKKFVNDTWQAVVNFVSGGSQTQGSGYTQTKDFHIDLSQSSISFDVLPTAGSTVAVYQVKARVSDKQNPTVTTPEISSQAWYVDLTSKFGVDKGSRVQGALLKKVDLMALEGVGFLDFAILKLTDDVDFLSLDSLVNKFGVSKQVEQLSDAEVKPYIGLYHFGRPIISIAKYLSQRNEFPQWKDWLNWANINYPQIDLPKAIELLRNVRDEELNRAAIGAAEMSAKAFVERFQNAVKLLSGYPLLVPALDVEKADDTGEDPVTALGPEKTAIWIKAWVDTVVNELKLSPPSVILYVNESYWNNLKLYLQGYLDSGKIRLWLAAPKIGRGRDVTEATSEKLLRIWVETEKPDATVWQFAMNISLKDDLQTYKTAVVDINWSQNLAEVVMNSYSPGKLFRQEGNGFTENEPNDDPEHANVIKQTIRGAIQGNGDIDWFKFQGVEGERLSIWIIADMNGSRLDGVIELVDSDGRTMLAWNDDDLARKSADPALWGVSLPHAGIFYIKVKSNDGTGSENHFYTLYLRREVATDDFGDDFDTATPIERGQRIEGIIGHRGDGDVFRFIAQQDEFLTVDVRARRDGSPLDAIVTLYWETTDENGQVVRKVIGTRDDVNGYDPTVRRLKLPATGTYYLEIRDFNGEGGADYRYTLNFQIEPPPMATIDTTPVTADVQMGEQKAQERKVGNIGGGSVGFTSIGQQSGKSRRDLPNPFNGRRQIIFLSPKQASVELEKESSPTRLRSPAALSQPLVGESKTLSTPEQKPTNLVGQTIVLPLPLGTRMVTRSATSRQASQPPDANAWQWIIVDPTVTTVENACNIHKVWMQRKADTLYFKVETSGRTFEPNAVLLKFNLDTDMRAETGVNLFTNMGVDFLVSIGEGTDGVWKWDSTTEGFAFVSDLSWVKIEGNFVELGFPLSAINDAEEFGLLVEMNDDDMMEQDSAPDEGFALITRLPSWLKVEPLAGTADSGQEVPVTLTLNAEAFDQTGEVSGTVQVLSSDPYKERQEIPIKVTVTPPQLPFEGTAGLFMVSLPIAVDKQWHEILNIPEDQMKLAIYDPIQGNYRLYGEMTPEERKPKPGVGVWMKLDSPVQTTVTGIPPKAREPFVIDLKPGWQIIGTPWQVKWANLKVRKGTEELSLQQAAERGWVYEILWTWDSELGDYQMVWAGVSGIGLLETLDIFRGYWILAFEECQLVIPPKSEATRGIPVGRKRIADNGFVFGLTAGNGEAKRRVWLGFVNDSVGRGRNGQGLRATLPPEAPEPSGLQIFAVGSGGKPLAADVRFGTPRKAEWDVIVKWDTGQGTRGIWGGTKRGETDEVTLTWEGLGYLPKEMSATLVDTVTGTRRYMRTQSAYIFRPQAGEKERRFKVILEQGGTGLLRILNLRATPVRGEGVVIQFALTKPATTQVEILTLTGRRVTLVESGRSRMAGQNTVMWRGVDSGGKRLPSGVYLVRVHAQDEEGRQVQAATMLPLR